MKILRRIIIIIATVSLLCIFALASESAADAGGYTVKSYDINIVVGDDNSYNVTETVVVSFTEQRHGIYRSIPVRLESGQKAKVKASVAGKKYKTYEENGNYIIKIGDEDAFASPVETYVIEYKYTVGYDYDEDRDLLYLNLIGAQTAAPIENVSFRITMPAPFDAQMVKFYSGYYGRMTDDVDYRIEGQTIEGTIPGGLIAYEALTVEIILPEGYYVNAIYTRSLADYISLAAPFLVILLLLAVLFIWNRYCRNPAMTGAARPFPPDGCNPADTAYIFFGRVSPAHITALITFWASKGYLAMSPSERGGGLMLTKKMDMGNERKQYERELFGAIFRTSDSVDLSRETTEYSGAIVSACTNVRKYWRGRQDSRIFESGGSSFTLCVALCWPALSLAVIYGANGLWQEIMASAVSVVICFPVCAALMLLFLFLGACAPDYGKSRSRGGLIAGGVTALLILIALIILGMGLIASLLILLSAAVTWFIGTQRWNSRKRTEYGNGMLDITLGFRNYISHGDSEQIRELSQKYGGIYYDTLAFAMAFGLEKQWTGHFKSFISRPPDWYDGFYAEPLTPLVFYSSFSREISHAQSVMTGQQSDSGGSSGSSSGGFSGGGSGGGGMGSW